MKGKVLISLLAIFLVGLFLISHSFYIQNKLDASIHKNEGDYVVLLHGLGRTSYSMQKIGQKLDKQGYKVININYPSRSDRIENLAEKYLKEVLEKEYKEKDKRINFVTHSMGGIIVRYFLANNDLENLNRVIMMAPPNKGSILADKWSNGKIGGHIMGPALKQMSTNEDSFVNTLPLPNYEFGIIAGKYDEKVKIERTKLENMKDFIIVPKEHTHIMKADETIDAIISFLEKGEF